MPKKVKRKNARETASITRQVIVTKSESFANEDAYDQARQHVNDGFEAVRNTLHKLEKVGIGVADLRPKLSSRTVEVSTPRKALIAISSCQSTAADIRISIHFENIENDIDEEFLASLEISHLIEVNTDFRAIPSWTCSDYSGLLARINIELNNIARLVHDVLLDISMARASHASWTGIRDTTTSRQFAAMKFDFAQKENLLPKFSYGQITGSGYLPLSSLVPIKNSNKIRSDDWIIEYIKIWEKFGQYCNNNLGSKGFLDKKEASALAKKILSGHEYSGQISFLRLSSAITKLHPGKYRIYFCVHRPKTKAASARMAALFHKNPAKSRTQMWVIHKEEGLRDVEAKYLIERNYLVYYSFVIGDLTCKKDHS